MIEFFHNLIILFVEETAMVQNSKMKNIMRNIVDQLIDSDVLPEMTISELVYSYFEESFLKIINPMVEVVIDDYVTVNQIESIIYALKQRTNTTTASEIHDTINKTYGREIV